jgi:hypothetical protein
MVVVRSKHCSHSHVEPLRDHGTSAEAQYHSRPHSCLGPRRLQSPLLSLPHSPPGLLPPSAVSAPQRRHGRRHAMAPPYRGSLSRLLRRVRHCNHSRAIHFRRHGESPLLRGASPEREDIFFTFPIRHSPAWAAQQVPDVSDANYPLTPCYPPPP